MSFSLNSFSLVVNNTGGAYNVPLSSLSSSVLVDLTGTMTGSVTIAPTGTAVEGTAVHIYLSGSIVLGANTFTVFGLSIPAAKMLCPMDVFCNYTGGSWFVHLFMDFNNNGTPSQVVSEDNIVNSSITANKIASSAVTTAKIDASAVTAAKIATDAVETAKIQALAVTTAKIDAAAVTAAKIATDAVETAKIQALAVTTAKIADGAITLAKLDSGVRKDVLVVEVSFESNEVGSVNSIKMPYAGKVNNIYWQVIHPLAGSNDGTVTPQDGSGNTMTGGLITIAASSILDTAGSVTITANNTFTAGQYLKFTTAKTTAGGKARLSIEVERT